MGAIKFNPLTPNNEVGLYFVKSRRVTLDVGFGEMATWIKCTTAGTIVFYNSEIDETSVINVEAGEAVPIVCDKILTTALVDGTTENTTATGLFWITTPQQLAVY